MIVNGPANLQVKERIVLPGAAMLEAAAAGAGLLLPSERGEDSALTRIAIPAPLMLGPQVRGWKFI